jgi:hypothetical protein
LSQQDVIVGQEQAARDKRRDWLSISTL